MSIPNPPIPEAIPLSSSFSLNDNASNTYYLHNGDNPGLLLVPQPLTGDNYNTWSRSMTMALFAKNKLQFTDGTLPHSSTLNGPEFRV
jgi:predicted YcjX-like family ATPase